MKKKIFELFVCILLVGTSFVVTLNTVRAPQDGDYIYTVSGGVATITGYNGTGGAITIPSTLGGYPTVAIGDGAFESCTSLTSVTISNSVTTIGNYSFSFCYSLTSVTIGNGVTTIGDYAFDSCSSLTVINVDAANVNYASVDGVLYNKVITTLIQCPGGKAAVSIPSSVTTIGFAAFESCTSLTSVTIPNSVTTIGKAAFYHCSTLTSITFLGLVAPTTVGENWITLTPVEILGHAYAASNFPPSGGVWNGLTMGGYINQSPDDIIYVDDDNIAGPWNGSLEHPYQHIKDGINVANSGEIVFVFNGTYYENNIVDKSISIIGENRYGVSVLGDGITPCFNITANEVNISGFTIGNYNGTCITLESSSSTITNNMIYNASVGILASENSSDNLVYRNSIFIEQNSANTTHQAIDYGTNNWDNGYFFGGNYWMDYTGNDSYHGPNQDIPGSDGKGDTPYLIYGGENQDNYPFINYDGWLQPPISSSDIYVDDDNIAGPWDGTPEHPYQHIQDGVDAVSEGGTVFVFSGTYYENVVINKDSISLIGADKNTTIIDANGIGNTVYIGNQENNVIQDFTIKNAANNGIYIYGYADSGSAVYESINNRLLNCIICDNAGNGVYIHSTGRCCHIINMSILNCDISSNDVNGIYLNADGNHCNIGFLGSIIISNTTISNNSHDGILQEAGYHHSMVSSTIISNCIIYDNDGYGMNIALSPDCWNDGHIIYHNNFVNNGQNAYDAYDSSVNKWYNALSQEGNYWSDYTGVDNNHDGIGDTPYNISGGSNQDLYPLMQPYSPRKTEMGIIPSLSKILPGQTFNVTIYIDPTVGIGGWEIFTFSYTQGLLNATLVSPGPFWTAFFDPGIINNANGTITGIQSFTSGPYPGDNHTACVIQFTAVHPGRCHFNLSRVVVTDSAFNPLEVITSPATVIITSHPLVTNEYPINTATNVERPPTHLSAQVNVTESGSMDIFIRWKNHQGTWITLESFHMAGNNTYSYNPIGNDWIWGNTIYTWSINATDGTYWTNTTYSYTTKGNRYDINNDNIVNFQDAGLVWIHRTTLVPYDGLYDVNQDGNVNFQDAGLTWVNRD